MSVFSERKIDCHNHIFDPVQFPYQPDSRYHPQAHETATADYFHWVLDAYGVSHALIVGPNSGYGDMHNEALLDAIEQSNGRFKGMAVVSPECSLDQLAELKAKGIVGVTFNVAFHGVDHMLSTRPLMDKAAELDMLVQFQVQDDQLLPLADHFRDCGARLVIDHCGRPNVAAGVESDGFKAVLAMAETGRTWIKVSGFEKYSAEPFPFNDTLPFVQAIQTAFGEDRLLWGSDWPFLLAGQRMDYGTLLILAEQHFPNAEQRAKYFWKNAADLYGFPV
ncbi:MAG: amidohydrolase family protein [Oceanobacter sp.]